MAATDEGQETPQEREARIQKEHAERIRKAKERDKVSKEAPKDFSSEHSTVEREAPREPPAPSQEVTHEDVRQSLIRQGVRPTGNTASGLAASPPRVAQGTEVEPEGVDGEDNLLNPRKNSEAQTRPAVFTSNGSLPHGHVPTPGGPAPVGVLGDKAAQQAGVDAMVQGALKGPRQRRRVTQDLLDTMSKAEIRAVASDRGYDVPDASGRGPLKSAFLKAQEDDDSVEEDQDVDARLVGATPTAPVPTTSGGTGAVPLESQPPATSQGSQAQAPARGGPQTPEPGPKKGPPGGSATKE